MFGVSAETIDRLRKAYPTGSRVRLIKMDDPYRVMPSGLLGTVMYVDDLGTVHVSWDNGSTLGCVYGEDELESVV